MSPTATRTRRRSSRTSSLALLADLPDRRVAVVGATGSVGTTLVRLLAQSGAVDSLLLVARGVPKLEALAAEVGRRVPTTTSTDIHDVRGCDAVVLLTASADALLGAEHLAPGARVLDATQPRNTSPDLAAARPDVTVVDGGVVQVPGMHLRGGDIGLPRGQAYACFAETFLLGLAGHVGHFSTGVPTLDHVVAHPRPGGPVRAARVPRRPRRRASAGRCVGAPMKRVVLLGGGYVTLHAYGAHGPAAAR